MLDKVRSYVIFLPPSCSPNIAALMTWARTTHRSTHWSGGQLQQPSLESTNTKCLLSALSIWGIMIGTGDTKTVNETICTPKEFVLHWERQVCMCLYRINVRINTNKYDKRHTQLCKKNSLSLLQLHQTPSIKMPQFLCWWIIASDLGCFSCVLLNPDIILISYPLH